MDSRVATISHYWFDPEPADQAAADASMRRWFAGGAETDSEISRRFSLDAERAARGELDGWRDTAEGRLALVLLLDQFPRNLYRGTRAAFEQDGRALDLTLTGLQQGMDRELSVLRRVFFCMPLQHAESMDIQNRSVEVFESLGEGAPAHLRNALAACANYARIHRDLIARFGRFPHRNRYFGRADTEAEREFLKEGGPTFGQ